MQKPPVIFTSLSFWEVFWLIVCANVFAHGVEGVIEAVLKGVWS